MTDFFERVSALRREGQSFAVATVVARLAPVSAHLGDRAIVFADGRMEGFVGGACSCDIVRHEALEALRTRRARLVSIRPDATEDAESSAEHVVVTMRCASEGAVDVFVEPIVQVRRFVVVGATPVAEALVRVARGLDYDVIWVVDACQQHDIEPRAVASGASVATLEAIDSVLRIGDADIAAVVASQSDDDEQALEAILKGDVPYVGLVASRKRGDVIRARLEERGVRGVGAVRSPAGLDLGARVPAEVALSVLAEVVKLSPSQAPTHGTTCGEGAAAMARAERETAARELDAPAPSSPSAIAPEPAFAIDPVCGMSVDVATARQTADVEGATYYFCCSHCRADFVASPSQYLTPRA